MKNINEIPTYFDLAYQNSSKIFEAEEIKDLTPEQLYEAEKMYGQVVEKLKNGEDLDEGIISGLLGAGVGALAAATIMKGICSVLGIDTNGTLGKLLTSKLVMSSIGYTLGR
jgi:hypothetical protein